VMIGRSKRVIECKIVASGSTIDFNHFLRVNNDLSRSS
jgi:hypothetical protein